MTNVVGKAVPFQVTMELDTKLVPFTVSVSAALPATALGGERDEIVGSGLAGGLTVKLIATDFPPPGLGFVTVICALPADTTSPAGIADVI